MGWQEFTLTMISTLAWPIVILISALVIRRELNKK